MTNKTQVAKKSSLSKNANNKKKREPGTEKTTEEKTAVTLTKSKTKSTVKKSASKVSVEKKKSSTDLKRTKSTMSVTTIDKTTCDEKKEEKKGKKEKWPGEEAARQYSKSLANVNLQSEYDEIQKMTANIERCKFWESNSTRNRHPDYKCYDDTRVIVQMTKSDYINGTKINVPNFSPSIYLVQLPKLETKDAVEEFWRMVFYESCQSVHVIARPEELSNPGIEALFSQESGAYLYVDKFFVNTRKVEKHDASKADVFVVELLPDGCSNSLMCTVYLHTYWKQAIGPDRFGAQIRAAQQIAKNENGPAPTVLASVRGAGRNAALLSLAVIVDQLSKGKEPKINDIVRTIREQRPMAVDSYFQYASLYLATNWFIKHKVTAGPNTDDMMARIKKFDEKAAHSGPSSTMKQPTEEP